jgi:hypothetical protein
MLLESLNFYDWSFVWSEVQKKLTGFGKGHIMIILGLCVKVSLFST